MTKWSKLPPGLYPRTKTFSTTNPYNALYRIGYLYQNGWVQKPVTDQPNTFYQKRCRVIVSEQFDATADAPNHLASYYTWSPGYPSEGTWAFGARERDLAEHDALNKFRDKVYDTEASWGVNIAERQQSINMLATNVYRMRECWRALRSGNLGAFCDLLGIASRKKDGRMSRSETAKNAGSLWLEYHFGWEPLVKDIHDTIMFLDGDFPAGLVRSKSVRRGSLTVNMKGGTNLEVQFYTGSSMRAKVSLTNPMLHVANSMGVINPLTILWEVVPFSFVVDWFIPIGSYLNSYTDYFGIELIHGSKTRKSWARGKQWVTDSNGAVTSRQGTVEAVCIDRSLGIPSAKFPRFKSFKGFSPVRGATAVALLLQTLASERRYFNQRAGNRRK